MKLILSLFCTLLTLNIFAQITVDQNDMPASGDTIYHGVSTIQSFDPLQTGANFNWNFSNLTALTHRTNSVNLSQGYYILFISNGDKLSVAGKLVVE